jgi:acyl carrier protein phosphodiesterase
MMAAIDPSAYSAFVNRYEEQVLSWVGERTDHETAPEWYVGEASSVLNGLMARQATLTLQMAWNPPIWNEHVAPLILRTMIDAVISFRWILKDPKRRSQEYIGYGLGQAKLAISHLEKKLNVKPEDSIASTLMSFKEAWIASQRMMPFVEVNLGSWSGKSVRQMAVESEDEDLYNFSFTPFSSCVHNQWDHVHVFNTSRCDNPLHKWHRVPSIANLGISDDYLFRTAKYFDLTLASFDAAAGREDDFAGAREFFHQNIEEVYRHTDDDAEQNSGGSIGQGPAEQR